MQVSKDGQCLFISSGTKEDSEVWVITKKSVEEDASFTPRLLVPRSKDVRVHVEHIRDFFLRISNNDPYSKGFRLQTLQDEHLDLPLNERISQWENLLAPSKEESLIISEFDCFENFIAVYATQDNRPKIIVQDLDSKEFHVVQINDGDIGQIEPMLNN